MSAFRRVCRIPYVRIGVACILIGGVFPFGARGEEPAERFVASLSSNPALPPEAVDLMRKTWSNCEHCDGEEFLTQGLTLLSEPFRRALDAYDADQYDACVKLMAGLRENENPFLSVNAAAYEIKALVAMEHLTQAGQRIERLLSPPDQAEKRLAAYSYFAPEMFFLRGYCQLSNLRHHEAEVSLRSFLERYPDASQRLVLAAQQMLAEIANYQPGRIAEVADLMKFAGRRLAQGDSGESVQSRQGRILEILDKLIKEAQEQEKSSQNSSGSGSSGGGGAQSGQSPSAPMQDSMLPAGQARRGELRDRRKANPGAVWGTMPPAERKRVLQALKDNFPSRYRQLVEQYYEELAKKP